MIYRSEVRRDPTTRTTSIRPTLTRHDPIIGRIPTRVESRSAERGQRQPAGPMKYLDPPVHQNTAHWRSEPIHASAGTGRSHRIRPRETHCRRTDRALFRRRFRVATPIADTRSVDPNCIKLASRLLRHPNRRVASDRPPIEETDFTTTDRLTLTIARLQLGPLETDRYRTGLRTTPERDGPPRDGGITGRSAVRTE